MMNQIKKCAVLLITLLLVVPMLSYAVVAKTYSIVSKIDNDKEAIEIKNAIETQIYPAIVEIFDKNSNFLTGPRSVDTKITLKMTGSGTVASWDEYTNTLTVPYARLYQQIGNYDSKTAQINGIAHELTHYHFNGIAMTAGASTTSAPQNIPLWFREGIAEYGAHKYYTDYPPYKGAKRSIQITKEEALANYLMNKDKNYKETVEKNAYKTASWTSEGDWDTSIDKYPLIYYGGAFSFVNLYYKYDNDKLKFVFYNSVKKGFKFYTQYSQGTKYSDENKLKEAWFRYLENEYGAIKRNLNSWYSWSRSANLLLVKLNLRQFF